MAQLYCPIRAQWVAALPEEHVRQKLLNCMIQQLGYPKALIAVEKGLRQMPHLQINSGYIPDRRADILCFGKSEEANLIPILLVECKAIPLTEKVINQVVGYNAHVKARYIAIANATDIKTGWYDSQLKRYLFVKRLPAYQEFFSKLASEV